MQKETKANDDKEIVMLGVRMTKQEKRALKVLAAEIDMTQGEIIRLGIAMFVESRGVSYGEL